MEQEREKWNRRHFLLCLAFIARKTSDQYGQSKPVSYHKVIDMADSMVELLKLREEEQLRKEQK